MKWTLPRFALFLAVALMLWLWPSVLGGKVLLPLDLLPHMLPHEGKPDTFIHNELIADVLIENFAWKRFQREALAAGELPLWNPYVFCGHPLYTTGQTSTFYPLNWIFILVPLPQAYVVFTWLHLFLGGIFTYLFFRRIEVGPFGASVGGVVFAMGGFLAVRFIWPMLLGSAVWLPLMLLWVEAMSEPQALARNSRGIGLGALLFAQPILSGFFEIAFYAFFACGLYAIARCIRLAVRHRSPRRCGVYLGKLTAGCVLAAVLAAPQLLPFFEVMPRNIRAGRGDYPTAVRAALEGHELLNLVVPDALGNPAKHAGFNLQNRAWKPIKARNHADYYYFGDAAVGKNYVSVGFYFGVVPLALALMGIRAAGRERWFFWCLLGLAIAFALGTPIYKLFYCLVPGAEQVRTPFRWMYLAVFAGCYLAAVGAQRWHDRLARPVGRVSRIVSFAAVGVAAALCLVVLVLLFIPAPVERLAGDILATSRLARTVFQHPADLAGLMWVNGLRFALFGVLATVCIGLAYWRAWGPRGAAIASIVCIALVAVDLGQATYAFNTHADPKLLDRRSEILRRLEQDKGLFRIARYGPAKVLPPNLPTLYGLQDVGGYDSIILRDYAAFLGAVEYQKRLPYNLIMTFERKRSLNSPLLRLLNIRYLLASRSLKHPDWEPIAREGRVRLYRIRPAKALPRAFLVGQVASVASPAQAIERLRRGEIDVRHIATVQSVDDRKLDVAQLSDGGVLEKPHAVTITHYGSSSVEMQTASDHRRLLVLCDMYYPGWNVYVDGGRATIVIADGIFRGVSVPAGEHTIAFRFEPMPFRVGGLLSLTCLALLAVSAIAGRLRDRKIATPADRPTAPAPSDATAEPETPS